MKRFSPQYADPLLLCKLSKTKLATTLNMHVQQLSNDVAHSIVTHCNLAVNPGSNTSRHSKMLMLAVPGHILPQLAEKQQFRCPYCHNIQNVNLAPEVALQIMSKQRQDSWQKQSAEGAKQRQQQAEWSHASSLAHQDSAALNRLAAGAASQPYGQVCQCSIQP